MADGDLGSVADLFGTGDATASFSNVLSPAGGTDQPPAMWDPNIFGGGVTMDPLTGDPGGGGGMSLPGILANVAKFGGGLLGLKNLFFQSPTEKALEAGQKMQIGQARALGKTGKAQLDAYTTGKLTPDQQARVDQFRNQNLAKWRQYLADAGIPESSAMADIEAKVNMDTAAFANQVLQQDFTNAISALGLRGNTLAQAAASNIQQEAMISNAEAAAMKALAELLGSLG